MRDFANSVRHVVATGAQALLSRIGNGRLDRSVGGLEKTQLRSKMGNAEMEFRIKNYIDKLKFKESHRKRDRIVEGRSHFLNSYTTSSTSTDNRYQTKFLPDTDSIIREEQASMAISPHKPHNVQVIIVTQKRSGSSFMGEIFNQNLDFTYFYEPLTAITHQVLQGMLTNDSFTWLSGKIFDGILHRDFTKIPYQWWSGYVPKHTCESLTIREFYRLCGHNGWVQPPVSYEGYVEQMKILDMATRERRGVAIKTIRVQDLNALKDFATDPLLNVKILHLVRDPRGVMNSRMKMRERNYDLMRRKGSHADEVLDMCEHLDRNLAFNKESLNWLNSRYKLIRYEDLARNPIQTARDIYEFVEVNLPSTVKDWLRTHTNHTSGLSAFSHTRNSTKTAFNWRKRLSFSKVMEIQETCEDAMKSLGYLPLNSYEELRSLDVPVLTDLPE